MEFLDTLWVTWGQGKTIRLAMLALGLFLPSCRVSIVSSLPPSLVAASPGLQDADKHRDK